MFTMPLTFTHNGAHRASLHFRSWDTWSLFTSQTVWGQFHKVWAKATSYGTTQYTHLTFKGWKYTIWTDSILHTVFSRPSCVWKKNTKLAHGKTMEICVSFPTTIHIATQANQQNEPKITMLLTIFRYSVHNALDTYSGSKQTAHHVQNCT